MTGAELIEQLTGMLRTALGIIQVQSELLEQHGIQTFDGALESITRMLREEGKVFDDGSGRTD